MMSAEKVIPEWVGVRWIKPEDLPSLSELPVHPTPPCSPLRIIEFRGLRWGSRVDYYFRIESKGIAYEFCSHDLEWWVLPRLCKGLLGSVYPDHLLEGALAEGMCDPEEMSQAGFRQCGPYARREDELSPWQIRSWIKGLNVWDAIAFCLMLAEAQVETFTKTVKRTRGMTAAQLEGELIAAALLGGPSR